MDGSTGQHTYRGAYLAHNVGALIASSRLAILGGHTHLKG